MKFCIIPERLLIGLQAEAAQPFSRCPTPPPWLPVLPLSLRRFSRFVRPPGRSGSIGTDCRIVLGLQRETAVVGAIALGTRSISSSGMKLT